MKKIHLFFAVIIVLLCSITGCKTSKADINVAESDNETETSEATQDSFYNNIAIYDIEEGINVRSLAEFKAMREMAKYAQDEEFEHYLPSVKCTPLTTREDVLDFVTLVETVPFVKFIEGDITWISQSIGKTESEKIVSNQLFISTKAADGKWVRVQYMLHFSNDSETIEQEINRMSKLSPESICLNIVKSNDERITVYAETREDHPSGVGDLITWFVDIDGVLARVVFYTDNATDIKTDVFFKDLKISEFPTK